LDSFERSRVKEELRSEIEDEVRSGSGSEMGLREAFLGSIILIMLPGIIIAFILRALGVPNKITLIIALSAIFYMVGRVTYNFIFGWWIPPVFARSRIIVRFILVPLSGAVTGGSGYLLLKFIWHKLNEPM
jgi:hypothetical protein